MPDFPTTGFSKLRPFVLFVGPCLCLTAPAWADLNLVQNAGFETGTFADWTVNTSANNTWEIQTFGGSGGSPFAGSFFASDGCVGASCISGAPSEQSSLSQTLATTPGLAYDLSFEFNTHSNIEPNELEVLWNGSTVLDLGPSGTLGPIDTYQLFSVTGLDATSASTTLTFLGRQDPGWDALDNVDVTPVGATPEPSLSIWAVGAFLAFLWVARLRARVGRLEQRG
jgi:hypothetical protein